jgi:hypothetical protein
MPASRLPKSEGHFISLVRAMVGSSASAPVTLSLPPSYSTSSSNIGPSHASSIFLAVASSPLFRAFSHSYPLEFSPPPIGSSPTPSPHSSFSFSLSLSRVSPCLFLWSQAPFPLPPPVQRVPPSPTLVLPFLPLPPPSPPTASSPSVSSSSVLNLDPSGSPLTFRSVLAGPHRLQ